ncbi:MAG: hypothetical protein R3D67_13690 [Hyphomicrobiaceae bacterium]
MANEDIPGRERAVRVGVELADRRYDVLIGAGLIGNAAALIAERLGTVRCGIVTDTNVARHHLPALERSLAAEGRHAGTIVLEPGEATKSLEQLGAVSDGLIGIARAQRSGDQLAAASSAISQGLPPAWCGAGSSMQISTSLPAQVDSSVGGKTAINSRHGKNLIGAFHQPSLVIADTDVLSTLPERQAKAGYAEVVKYAGLLGDRAFYDWLDQEQPAPVRQ